MSGCGEKRKLGGRGSVKGQEISGKKMKRKETRRRIWVWVESGDFDKYLEGCRVKM